MAPALSSPAYLADMELQEGGLGLLAADLAQADFLQAMKSVEAVEEGSEGAWGELALLEEEAGEDARGAAARLERRAAGLERRLRLQQARALGRHAAQQAAARVPGRAAARRLLARLAREAALPRAGAPRAPGPGDAALAAAAGALRAELSLVARRLDPDATDSSSGAESADETQPSNDARRQPLPPTKRAMWKWVQERASIASRWTWLQAQIQELEYKIRQHAELQRRIRVAKGATSPQEPSGYSGCLPGQSDETGDDESCARFRPLNRTTFRKRKLLQMHNLHTAAEKAAKPSNIRCICQWPLGGCAVCTGRVLPMHPLPVSSTLTKQERLALIDPAYHPVLSSDKDVSASVQYSAKMKSPQWQLKGSKSTVIKTFKSNTPVPSKLPQVPPKILVVNNKSHSKKKKRSKSKRGRPTAATMELARVIQARRRTSMQDGGENSPRGDHGPFPSGGSSPVPSPSEYRHRPRERTRLNSSYDINNIVIPYSVAANTKLEILQYKEIPTPKWRLIESEESQTSNNGIVKKSALPTEENEVEDVSDNTVMLRHDRCEELEKGKYLQKRKSSRRQHSRSGAGSNPPLTPSETPPHTPATVVDETSMHSETGTPNTNVQTVSTNPQTVAPNTPPLSLLPASTSGLLIAEPSLANPIQLQLSSNTSTSSSSHKRRLTLQPEEQEIIPPYSPRQFPLDEETYMKMLTMMPDNHPLSVVDTEARRHHSTASCTNGSDSETNSTTIFPVQESTLPVSTEDTILDQPSDSEGDSCSVPPEEDPNDPEWNASAHAD